MKTFIFFLLFSVCCSNSIAQNYVPFPTSNAVWYETWGEISSGNGSMQTLYNFIDGDTIINNLLYHKIYTASGWYQSPWAFGFPPPFILPSVFNYTGFYTGAIREDSSKHVFYWPLFQNPPIHEYLLYDFNLIVGDTLSDSLYNIQEPFVFHTVYSIDSIFDGFIYRKRYVLNSPSYKTFLIEGIGSTRGLIQSINPFFEGWASLLCFSEDTIPKYSDLNFNLCSLTAIEENNNRKNSFTLSPNPTTKILNLKSEQPILFPVELFVMDMQGRLKTQKIIYSNDDLSLNVKAFANGVYLLAIKNKESVLYRGMFSKQ